MSYKFLIIILLIIYLPNGSLHGNLLLVSFCHSFWVPERVYCKNLLDSRDLVLVLLHLFLIKCLLLEVKFLYFLKKLKFSLFSIEEVSLWTLVCIPLELSKEPIRLVLLSPKNKLRMDMRSVTQVNTRLWRCFNFTCVIRESKTVKRRTNPYCKLLLGK